jgi:hypothetical protein
MNNQILKILLFYFPDSPEDKRNEAAKLLIQLKEKEKKDRQEQIESHPMIKYIVENYPNVAKLRLPTAAQCEELKKNFHTTLIVTTLEAMENTKTLTKDYMSSYLTLKKWCENAVRKGWDSTKKEQVYTRPEKKGN